MAILLLVASAVNCSGDPTGVAKTPTSISISPPNAVIDAIGATQSFQATVRDQNGNPIPGTVVQWSVQSTSIGSINSAGTLTAQANGTTQITASVSGVQGSVTVTVDQEVQSLAKTGGDNQSGPVGVQLPDQLQVSARDRLNNPVPGVSITFEVSTNGGQLSSITATTSSTGDASTSWTLGTAASTSHTVTARANGSSAQTTFTVDAQAGTPSILEKAAGDALAGTVGTMVPTLPSLRVTDAFGNPVSGATVLFQIMNGGGVLNGSSATTNAQGLASPSSWQLGNVPATNVLRATVPMVGLVDFSVDAAAGPPSIAVAHEGNDQSAPIGTGVAVLPSIRVTDAVGNGISGVPVTFAVTAGGGNITGANTVTDIDGVARVASWTMGVTPGLNRLTVTAGSLAPVQINATAAMSPAFVVIHEGNNQSAPVATNVAVAPAVRVTTAEGIAAPGVSVAFAILSGGGSVGNSLAITDANGVASAGSWTLGATAGANSLSATASGVGIAGNPITFSATGTVASSFNIELRFLTPVTPAQQTAFNNAVARWQTIITGDIPQFNANIGAGQCGSNSPAVNEPIDDLIIFVTLEPIDGVGTILGSAGPCWIRGAGLSYHPFLGRMRFDSADLANMEGNGLLEPVILHEMGHVLGIGTLWGPGFHNLLVNPSLPSSPGVDTHLNAPNAITAFNSVGGGTYVGLKVPVENMQGGSGTRDAHWRESVFQNELMTGFVSLGSNPMSIVTIRFLQDMGYVVNPAAADAYTLPGGGLLMDLLPRVHLLGDVISDPIRIGGVPPSDR